MRAGVFTFTPPLACCNLALVAWSLPAMMHCLQ